ncbi:TPR and ankyrin repeat-containing protein 1-like [Mercenaria mercenaria]|uniref:TPR and ankyrin repeat-containing protein 1-like n=1 Tax=Mercenaria mercenaria TaxID=6596 RepID=UPI00234E629B|nr:TPR and ankyrin repeat-containing protein 1-like [Mercenaria mercenaria]
MCQVHSKQALPAQIANEHHVILCGRSLVHYKLGMYQQAEEDASAAIETCRNHLESYWRASQAIMAYSTDKQHIAMSYLVSGLNVALEGKGSEQDKVDFLTEICKLVVEAPITGEMISILCSVQLPDTRDNAWLSVLKELSDQSKWESIAMLLIHYDPRGVQNLLNTLDVSQWHCGNINLGNLVNSLSDENMRLWGERLAVCLLEKGASVGSSEQYKGPNALHHIVKLSLRIGSVILLKSVLENYEDAQKMIHALDENGNSALQIIHTSEKASGDIGEAVLTLLLEHECNTSVQDNKDKTPIDFVDEQSKLYSLPTDKSSPVKELRKRLELFMTEGQTAIQNKHYSDALNIYDEALVFAKRYPELYKEVAILHSNKSSVLYLMGDFESALASAIDATSSDPKYSKGYYWYGKALLCSGSTMDAFLTFIDGCYKSSIDSDQVDLLTEAVAILNSLSGAELRSCYDRLYQFNTSVWPDVITQLSERGEWKTLAYLILGTDLEKCRLGEIDADGFIDRFCTGVARKSSTVDIKTWTVFKYLEQHNGECIGHWLDAVLFAVYTNGGEQMLRNLTVDDRNCPLHTLIRFVLQTESTALLKVLPNQGPGWRDIGSMSVFHILAWHSPSPPADFLVKVTKLLFEKGYRNIADTGMGYLRPYDYLDIKYPMYVFDLFLPDDMCDASMKIEKLHETGRLKHSRGEFSEAILLFKKALDLSPMVTNPLQVCSQVLLSRADSYLQLEDYQRALSDASLSLKNIRSFHRREAHLIAGKALTALKKYEPALREFQHAYTSSISSNPSEMFTIFSEVAKLVSQLPKSLYEKMMTDIAQNYPAHGQIWARTCHLLVQCNEWKSARIAYIQFSKDGLISYLPLILDLKPFCRIVNIKSNQWITSMMLYLLQCGSDKTTISLEEGDTYLHAAVRMSLVANSLDMLSFLIQEHGSDQHRIDRHGNTLLHVATKEKGVVKTFRKAVIKLLLERGVNPHIENNEEKLAISYLTGERQSKELICREMQKTRKQDAHKTKSENKSRENDAMVVVRSKTDICKPGKEAYSCKTCEQLYSDAIKKLSTDKTGGLALLVDVLNIDHNNKKTRKKFKQGKSRNKQHARIETKVINTLAENIDGNWDESQLRLKSLRKETYFKIIHKLVICKRWVQLVSIIEQYKSQYDVKELKARTSKYTIEPMIADTSLTSEEETLRVTCYLLDSGWRIGNNNGRDIMKKSVKLKKFKLAIELISRGADISEMSVYEGDTPIHAAIYIALQEKQHTFIEILLDKQANKKGKYSYLDPGQADAHGDSIYHLLAKADYTDLVLQITQILRSRNIRAPYKDKMRKYPCEYVTVKSDCFLKLLEETSSMARSSKHVTEKKLVNQKLSKRIEETKKRIKTLISNLPANSVTNNNTQNTQDVAENNIGILQIDESTTIEQSVEKPKESWKMKSKAMRYVASKATTENDVNKSLKESKFDKGIKNSLPEDGCENSHGHRKEMKRAEKGKRDERRMTLEDIAENMRFASKDTEDDGCIVESANDSFVEDDAMSEPPPLELDEDVVFRNVEASGFKVMPKGVLQQTGETNNPVQVDAQNVENGAGDKVDADMDLEINIKFENLTWDVECTDKVLKILKKRVEPKLKQKVVKIIQTLASGDWQKHLCKELTNVPSALKLFEAKVSKGGRILWEKAINFSSRYNDPADDRLNSFTEDTTEIFGGRIYSEVIRVWDIVMDHDKLKRQNIPWRPLAQNQIIVLRSVENIKHSHRRGKTCAISSKLKGIKENEQHMRERGVTYPLLFTEIDPEDNADRQVQVQHFPPASASETEYNILKFYPWDTTLVKHILQSCNVKVDFPFKVTDLEHAIINLSGKEAILLLGRSGTGKTTCCLYRLWSQFKSYWYNTAIDRPMVQGSGQEHVHEKSRPSVQEERAESNYSSIEETSECKQQNDVNCKSDSNTCVQFHQIFVTKNPVLVSEVKKTFCGFMNADELLARCHAGSNDQSIPNRLQDLQENAYPLFLTSRELLCKLDASLGHPFFEREKDGSLKYQVHGWADTAEGFTELNVLDHESTDEDSDDRINGNVEEARRTKGKRKNDTNVRREVTYDVFENKIWPKLKGIGNSVYHPSLIWTEIISFIKGSYESLSKTNGYLSKNEYLKLGRKKAPAFSGEREEVYDMFLVYERKKKQLRLFDETDVVRSVFQRLAHLETSPVTIHQIYVDETQDFTQAELFLLIRLCQNPNDMFLTGDTAQSIMRGISFRFKDLRSLFFHVKEMTEEAKKTSQASKSVTVHVPNEVLQLTYNYRSHSGILSLASSILEILLHFFPESFDRLHPDKGLFIGPEPILLESCSSNDLATLLKKNQRETSSIEFGAHQVILVVNEEARESMPEELRYGLVLTIYESKGLEFDDVLLYNFFKDSKASKEWRVVTKHLEEIVRNVTNKTAEQNEVYFRIEQDVLSSKDRQRPLDFDPNKHKILNYELKQLYTAVTRARVNVWIFDEDHVKRGPMFEYFKARKLVKLQTDINNETLSQFAVKSNKDDWLQQGDYFMKNRRYSAAATCFRQGDDQKMLMLAQANQQALLASRKEEDVREMRAELLSAAEIYLKCDHVDEAAKCLSKAKEMTLAATLYEKLGQYDMAAEQCKRNKQFEECSSFYERSWKFNKAVSILYENRLYHLALDVVKRYKRRENELLKNDHKLLEQLRANKPDDMYTEEELNERAAEEFYKLGKTESMREAVGRFQYEEDKIEFFKRHECISEAANILADSGRFPEAIDLLLQYGMFSDARNMAQSSKDERQIAKCLLIISRVAIVNTETATYCNDIKENLKKALLFSQQSGDRDLCGQVMLLQAQVYKHAKYVLSAAKEFIESRPYPNEAGYVECCNVLTNFVNKGYREHLKFLLTGADCLFNVCKTLLLRSSSSSQSEKVQANFQAYCQFYGIVKKGQDGLIAFPATKPLCAKIFRSVSESRSNEVSGLEEERNIKLIVYYLLKESKSWLKILKDTLEGQRSSLQICRSFALGHDCTNGDNDTVVCSMMHTPHTETSFKRLIDTDLLIAEYETYINKTDDIWNLCKSKHDEIIKRELSYIMSAEISINENEKYQASRFLWDDFLPESGHPLFLAEKSSQFITPVCNNEIGLKHLKYYLVNRWNQSIHGKCKTKSKAVHETEIFLLFEFAYHLFHFETGKVSFEKTPKQEMLCFENALDIELQMTKNQKEIKHVEKRYTLMVTYPDEQSNLAERAFTTCVAHRFTDAYEDLMKGDPFEALESFGQFQCQLSQRSLQAMAGVWIYPDIHHYLLWLEFYSALAFFLMAKAKSQVDKEFTFILPNNYLALMYFIQGTFPESSQSIHESIQSWTPETENQSSETVVLERVKQFAFVISGHAQKAKMPEIILKKCQKDSKNYVLLERLIILHMTMICNVGKSVPIECENCLVNSLNSINKMLPSSSLQARLKKIHDQVNEFKGIRDVADCLKNFFTSRNMGEILQSIKWVETEKEKYAASAVDNSLFQTTFSHLEWAV